MSACLTVPDLAAAIEVLGDQQRREVNAVLIGSGCSRFIADSNQIDGYRELGQKCADLERERDLLSSRLRALLDEARNVASLKHETVHRGSGPPSNYDPDIYQLERVTATGWWRFVHAVRDAAKETP